MTSLPMKAIAASPYSRILAGIEATCIGLLTTLYSVSVWNSTTTISLALGLVGGAVSIAFVCRAMSKKKRRSWMFLWASIFIIFFGLGVLPASSAGGMIFDVAFGSGHFDPRNFGLVLFAAIPLAVISGVALAGWMSEIFGTDTLHLPVFSNLPFEEY